MGNMVSAASAGLFWLLVASIISTDDYGILSYDLALISILGSVALIGSTTTVTTYVAKDELNIVKSFSLPLLLTTLACSAFLLFSNLPLQMFLALLGLSFFTITTAEKLGQRKFKEYMLMLIAHRVLQISLSVLLFYFLGIGGIILGYAAGYLTFSWPFIIHLLHFKTDLSSLRSHLRYTIHSYAVDLSKNLSLFADKLIIAPVFGFAILGMYQLGMQFLLLLAVIPSVFFSYTLPQEASGSKQKGTRIFGIVSTVILSLLFIVLAPSVIPIVFPKFSEAVPIIQLISIGALPMAIVYNTQSSLLASENTKPVFISAAIFVGSQYGLILILGHALGALGLAIAIVSALSIQCAFISLYSRHYALTRTTT